MSTEINPIVKKVEEHVKQIEQFKFNQQANFLYHFVNKFTDVTIDEIKKELKQMLK